ncbi:MAG: hypothetical protein Ct9H300mP1_02590 [Planctomycetaceae bacterium]|nr:MAG: hypothetical protein Ct9H300mP1_02590 [Planctomycetaceae bacterium]
MFEIAGEEHVRRFRERDAGLVARIPGKESIFAQSHHARGHEFEISPDDCSLDEAVESVYIEMAYIGDPDLSQAIVNAAGRGVEITMLFSGEANIGDDLNWRALPRDLSTGTGAGGDHRQEGPLETDAHRQSSGHPRGSANLSVFSMGKRPSNWTGFVRGLPRFLESVQAVTTPGLPRGTPGSRPGGLKPYNRVWRDCSSCTSG